MSSADPPVSVVLPTYNRAATLSRSIQSVLNQTYEEFELIVVDDASTDTTDEVVNGFDDPRIDYVKHDVNRGVSAARNTGIHRARGDIIAFQDSDDEWLPEKLQRHMEAFRDAPTDVGVVYTGMWRIVDGEERYLPYPGVEHKVGDIGESIVRNNFISTQMAAVRRECFDRVGGFDEALPALVDWELWIRISQHYCFEFIDEPLVRAAVQSDSLSENRRGIVRARERIVKKHFERFDSHSLANHLFFVGHGAMKHGHTEKGRLYLKRAVTSERHPGYVIAWIFSFFGSTVYNLAYRLLKSARSGLSTSACVFS